MSINNPDDKELGILASAYEEFEDILEPENDRVGSTEALLLDCNVNTKITLTADTLRQDIERVEKLRPEEVRWFYRSGKKKKWKAFVGSDSILIETEWRCVSKSDSEIQRVCVRGGMYEVDVLERKCYPVYWSSFNLKGVEDSVEITRGTWFYDGSFVPIEEGQADRIEAEHVERWKGCSLDEVKFLIGNTVMHSVKLPNCHVDWYTVNDVYMHSDAVSYRALRNIVQRFGASKTSTSGSRLHRGYREDAMHEDCIPPVEHVVFMVHGIGAKHDRHKIVRNTNEFRVTCDRVAAKHFAHYTGRVEFLPVEWRSKVVLDGGIVETLTPKKGMGVRQFLNNNVMDVLYYTSPLYKGEVVQALKAEISRLHGMFLERNPDYDGKISVFAHSLGSVIMHDIMTGWSPESLFEEYLKKQQTECDRQMAQSYPGRQHSDLLEMDLHQLRIERAKISQLEVRALGCNGSQKGLGFVVDNYFSVGSPLAMFLSLRGQRPSESEGTQSDIIPQTVCRRIFNIFHPADPVAYRLEPLVLSHYSGIAPLQIHWNNALHKTPYDEMPAKAYVSEAMKEMTTVSAKEPSSDPDCASADISDVEDLSLKDGVENEIEDGKTESPVENTHSPVLTRRSSYLKAISGGAYRVGKALWGKARGSSPTRIDSSNCVSPDSSLVSSRDEINEEPYEETINEENCSMSSSRSGSPVPKVHRPLALKTSLPDNGKRVQADESTQQYNLISSNVLQLEHRLDYELQEGFTESRLGYASITSHTAYWSNQDVALFVLMQIHPKAAMVQSMRS